MKRILPILLIFCLLLCFCEEKIPSTSKGISLSDAPQVLDITEALPPNFERLDAAEEGYSHRDLGLSNYASKVELFASGEPYGIVYCYFSIFERRTQQIEMDTLLKDDEQAKYFVNENMKALAGMEDVKIVEPIVTHPTVGDLAVLMEASITSHGTKYNLDLLTFKVGEVYAYLYSIYFGSDRLPLLPIAQAIERNIAEILGHYKTMVSLGYKHTSKERDKRAVDLLI